MKLAIHLLRRHILLYSFWWAVMFAVLLVFLASFEMYGPWILDTEAASAWSLPTDVAPGWFLFAMGVVLVTLHLPVAIAHGVTRRDFAVGAGLFALASAALFELMRVVGLLVESVGYRMTGLMDELSAPYPWPTLGGSVSNILRSLAFMCSGWLIALLFYRLRIWWALLATPLGAIPLAAGMEYYAFDLSWVVIATTVTVSLVVCYLASRGVAIRPRKA